jgi:hypothetical protein
LDFNLNITQLDDGIITYETKVFTGSEKMIGRYIENGVVKHVVMVETREGAANEINAYGTLLVSMANRKNERDFLAEEIRRLSENGMQFKDIAKELGKSGAYISQLAMLYEINSSYRRRTKIV